MCTRTSGGLEDTGHIPVAYHRTSREKRRDRKVSETGDGRAAFKGGEPPTTINRLVSEDESH